MIARVKSLLQDPDFIQRGVRFLVVGLGCTALYFVIAIGLVYAKLHVTVAHIIAYAISITASYAAQKILTFRIRGDHRRAAPRFIIATAAIAAVQFALIVGLSKAGLDDRLTVLISTLYYPAASFVVHSLWTFAPQARPPL